MQKQPIFCACWVSFDFPCVLSMSVFVSSQWAYHVSERMCPLNERTMFPKETWCPLNERTMCPLNERTMFLKEFFWDIVYRLWPNNLGTFPFLWYIKSRGEESSPSYQTAVGIHLLESPVEMHGLVKDVTSKKAFFACRKVSGGQARESQHVTSMPNDDQARAAIIEEAIKNIVMGSKNPPSRCPDPTAKRQKITLSSTDVPDPHFLCFRTEGQAQTGLDFANGTRQYPEGDHDGSHAMCRSRHSFVHPLAQNTTAPPSPSHDQPLLRFVHPRAQNTTAPPSPSHDQPLLRHVVIVPDSPSSGTLHQPPSRHETPGSVSMDSMWSGRETPQMQDCFPGMAHAQMSSFQEIRNITQTTQREAQPQTWPQHGGAMDSKIISLRLERDALRSALEMSRMREKSSFQMLQELRSQLLDAYRVMGRSAFEKF